MKLIWVFLIIVILIIFLIIGIWYFFRHQDPYYIASWLNSIVENDRLKQNQLDMENQQAHLRDSGRGNDFRPIPSYCVASKSQNKLVRELNDELLLHFDQIKEEILSLLPSDRSISDRASPNKTQPEYQGLPMVELDPVQHQFFKGKADEWRVIWVRFLNQWGRMADHLPTLKRILENYPEIILLHVSIMAPGTILPEHEGVSKAVLRYHLPIQIPKGDVYLELEGQKIKWVEREGFVFDDCLRHSVTMKPEKDEYRIIIFADIPREYDGWSGSVKSSISNFFHSMIRENDWIRKIKQKI
uniref:Aspartyl/asparaginyl beta-hydroxylase n=1 Tax=Pithovirus LCPAC201 TaxID=2506591 RepID=A0A481Z802_9VIRU|nr:MAG: aspartyl/asparaginyl beta-hydroxylase [Pithovirus LCPAC201]